MAERRMFAKTIIDSDAFLDMPLSTQALYFHLSMRADDDGFINNPKKIQRMIGASDDDLKLLIAKNFIIPFESGIVVIKHWRIHNYIQKDRYKPTVYKDEMETLRLKDNNAYTTNLQDGNSVDTECIHDGYSLETQVSIGKDSIDKDNNISYARFEETYKLYPRKGDKKRAYACYKARINEGYREEELLEATKNYAEFCRKENREQRFIKVAPTFYGVNTPFVDFLPKDSERGVPTHLIENSPDEFKSPYFGLPEEFFKGEAFTEGLVTALKDVNSGKVYSADDVINLYFIRRESAANGGRYDIELRFSH